MEERSKDGFDEIEEDFRKKCLYTDSDNLYLFGNFLYKDTPISPILVIEPRRFISLQLSPPHPSSEQDSDVTEQFSKVVNI